MAPETISVNTIKEALDKYSSDKSEEEGLTRNDCTAVINALFLNP